MGVPPVTGVKVSEQEQAREAHPALHRQLQHRGLVRPIPDEQEHEQEILLGVPRSPQPQGQPGPRCRGRRGDRHREADLLS